MKIYQVEQGTDAWLQLRAGKITASRARDAREVLKTGKPSAKQTAYAAQVAVERIACRPIDQVFENWQMREGHAQEPLCRAAYETISGNFVEEIGAFATDDDVFLYSPDGVVGDDGLVEIKTLFSGDRIVSIVAGGDYSDFMDQCLFGLWITGRQWIDLCIWAPSLESIGLHITIHRITRDEAAIEALETDLVRFAKVVSDLEHKLRLRALVNVELLKEAA